MNLFGGESEGLVEDWKIGRIILVFSGGMWKNDRKDIEQLEEEAKEGSLQLGVKGDSRVCDETL